MVSKFINKIRKFFKKMGFLNVESHLNMNIISTTELHDIHPIITKEKCNSIDNAIKISYIGDLILLRDMVQKAWDEKKQEYDFKPMFEFVTDILSTSDLSLGIFEGPMAGKNWSYSTSTFYDGLPIQLNFPDSFGEAVYKAGLDIVSLANNHIYDCGQEGLMRTLDVLDKIGINHVGGYRNATEKETIYYWEKEDLKIAIIAFTYCPNGLSDEFFFNETTRDVTIGIVSPDSPFLERNKNEIRKIITRAKKGNPDLIIAMPHMGTQFTSQIDEMQKYWVDFLVKQGVDIILGDHAHHIQPIQWIKRNDGETTLVVYCPGNYVNSYIEYEGDLSMLVNVYISRDKKRPFAVGCIPLYAYADKKSVLKAIPFKTLFSGDFQNRISHNESKHLSHLHKIFSSIVLGKELTIDQIQSEYMLFLEEGYMRNHVSPIINVDAESSVLSLIRRHNKICFIGDSITEGTLNGGYGWYEPLMAMFLEKNICKIAFGGATVKSIQKEILNVYNNLDADLYIVAIGCNDIRYRDESKCAMTAKDYIESLCVIVQFLTHNTDSDIVFISPWESADFDPYCKTSNTEKNRLYAEYAKELYDWCTINKYWYVNPNPYIKRETNNFKQTEILIDHIHPNANEGIYVYSQAVIYS